MSLLLSNSTTPDTTSWWEINGTESVAAETYHYHQLRQLIIHDLRQLLNETGRLEHLTESGLRSYDWNRHSAIFYVISIYTTIGYGNVVCETFWGKVATLGYAIIGIPLFLSVLSTLGIPILKVAQKIRFQFLRLYERIKYGCCKSQIDPFKQFKRKPLKEDEFPLYLALLVLTLYLWVSTAIFLPFERNWTYFDAFYFNFISLSTIGFGDYVPDDPRNMSILFIVVLVGLAIVSMCIAVIQNSLEERYMDAMDLMEEAYELGSSIIEDLSSVWERDDENGPNPPDLFIGTGGAGDDGGEAALDDRFQSLPAHPQQSQLHQQRQLHPQSARY